MLCVSQLSQINRAIAHKMISAIKDDRRVLFRVLQDDGFNTRVSGVIEASLDLRAASRMVCRLRSSMIVAFTDVYVLPLELIVG